MISNFSITLIILLTLGLGFQKNEIEMTMVEAEPVEASNTGTAAGLNEEDEYQTKLQIGAGEHFLFDDNPDDHELKKRGCCRCGNEHHCCGKMCHGKK